MVLGQSSQAVRPWAALHPNSVLYSAHDAPGPLLDLQTNKVIKSNNKNKHSYAVGSQVCNNVADSLLYDKCTDFKQCDDNINSR